MTRLVSVLYNDFFPFNALKGVEHHVEVAINPAVLSKEDILLVWGGEDISPALYNRKAGPYTAASDRPSRRDMIEWGMMDRAAELGIPIVGVCRGAQMLCAFAGGFLIQDTDGHANGSPHAATTDEGIEILVNSYHHQMLYPFEVEHEMWAECKKPLGTYHMDVDRDIEVPTEPEFVHFPKVRGFAIQWHPEWMDDNCNATQFALNKINSKL